MAQAPPQQSSGQDSGLGPLWISLLILLALVGIWLMFRSQIVWLVIHVKLFEAQLMAFFTTRLNEIIQLLDGLLPQIQSGGGESVTLEDLQFISRRVGEWTRYPIIILLLIFAVILYRSDITSKYKRTYSMKDLLWSEKDNWPQVMPIMNVDLIETDLLEGPWSMALNPIEFSEKHKLVRKELGTPSGISRRERKIPRFGIARGEAKRVFTLQLGPYWENPESLPIHTRVLFAIFAAKMNRGRKETTDLLEQINRSASSGNLNFSGYETVLKKYYNTKPVQKIIKKHAYVLTVMASMLKAAREDGVLATAEFLWLKPLDRNLWYMLNCVGRQTPYVEVAGPFAHWITENELGRKSMMPMVDEAVKGLEGAFKGVLYTPEEPELQQE